MGNAFLPAPKTEKSFDSFENGTLACGLASMQGWRIDMEDAHVCVLGDAKSSNVSLFGVFDGHCGSEVAHFCSARWPDIVRAMDSFPKDLQETMKRSFYMLDEQLLDPAQCAEFFDALDRAQHGPENNKRARNDTCVEIQRDVESRMNEASTKGTLSSDQALALAEAMVKLEKSETRNRPTRSLTRAGCTAICAALCGKTLVVANAGDSRGVLCRKNGAVLALSEDHKPTNDIERKRIYRAGGYVSESRVNGQLALSRAIGDFEFKQNSNFPPSEQQVTCDPDIMTVELLDDDEFIILACDGIWDCVSNEEAVSFIRPLLQSGTSEADAAGQLLDHCLAPDTFGTGTDNMTCLIVRFKHL